VSKTLWVPDFSERLSDPDFVYQGGNSQPPYQDLVEDLIREFVNSNDLNNFKLTKEIAPSIKAYPELNGQSLLDSIIMKLCKLEDSFQEYADSLIRPIAKILHDCEMENIVIDYQQLSTTYVLNHIGYGFTGDQIRPFSVHYLLPQNPLHGVIAIWGGF